MGYRQFNTFPLFRSIHRYRDFKLNKSCHRETVAAYSSNNHVDSGELSSQQYNKIPCCGSGNARMRIRNSIYFSNSLQNLQGFHHILNFKSNASSISKPFYNTVLGIHTSSPCFNEVKTVVVPPFADSVSEGDVRWEKGVGDYVKEDEIVAQIETDKTAIAIPAPANGVIESFLVEDGATVKAGQELFKLKITGEVPAGVAKAEKPAAAPPPPEAAAPPPAAAPPSPSPAAPAPPAQQPSPIPKSPPPPPPKPTQPLKQIPVPDINITPMQTVGMKRPPADFTKEIVGSRAEQRVKMNRMRLRIAQRLKDAQNTNAMLTTFNELDMSNIMEMRKLYQDRFTKKYNIKLGFMSAFLKASAYALQHQPVVNAVIDGNEIIYRDYVDISVAVATPKGLVVPVVRGVESMNYAEIELAIMKLGEKAKANALAIEDMDGGTFTISNGGVFGSLFGTPIINPPQSAILGMHGTFERPVAVKGQVVVRPMMYIALTYDHRLIDGREAVTFLKTIKNAVEDPRILLMGL